MTYRLLYKLVLRRLSPEWLHHVVSTTVGGATRLRPVRGALRRLLSPRDPCLRVRALGLDLPSPLGAAAGIDKDASWFEGLGALGFGFVEVGTVTAEPQPGDPKPRLARLTSDEALVNRMGFPNPGAKVAGRRLGRRTGETAIGANVGRSKDTPNERAADDYRACVRQLSPHSDYIAVNVSSPNTPGLREMQAVDILGPLVSAVRGELRSMRRRLPILVKIGPDLSDEELDAVAALSIRLEVDGILATNTTTDRTALSPSSAPAPFEGGGVSGAPLKARALAVLRRLYENVGHELVLVSVGGIDTPDEAWERILAGATLVQAYTGFVFGGPAWPWAMNRDLARRVRRAGASSIQDLIGAGAPRRPTGLTQPSNMSAAVSARTPRASSTSSRAATA